MYSILLGPLSEKLWNSFGNTIAWIWETDFCAGALVILVVICFSRMMENVDGAWWMIPWVILFGILGYLFIYFVFAILFTLCGV